MTTINNLLLPYSFFSSFEFEIYDHFCHAILPKGYWYVHRFNQSLQYIYNKNNCFLLCIGKWKLGGGGEKATYSNQPQLEQIITFKQVAGHGRGKREKIKNRDRSQGETRTFPRSIGLCMLTAVSSYVTHMYSVSMSVSSRKEFFTSFLIFAQVILIKVLFSLRDLRQSRLITTTKR